MTRPKRFHRLARKELLDAVAFYEERVDGLGLDFWAEVDGALCHGVPLATAETDAAGRPVRRFLLRRFPFSLLATIRRDGTTYVVAVAHQKRRPGYWRSRLLAEGDLEEEDPEVQESP